MTGEFTATPAPRDSQDGRTGAVFSGASFGPALREAGPSRRHDCDALSPSR